MIFFVYIDRTNEGRPFNIGKGLIERVNDKRHRSKKWKNVTAKHGCIREVVFATKDEKAAFDMEITLIAEHKTYCYANKDEWGCNFTRGGEGGSGAKRPDLRNKNLSAEGKIYTQKGVTAAANLKRGKPGHRLGKKNPGASAWNATQAGKNSIKKAIVASADSRRGKPANNRNVPHSSATKQKISDAKRGKKMKPFSDAHKSKLRQSAIEREQKKRDLRLQDMQSGDHPSSSQ